MWAGWIVLVVVLEQCSQLVAGDSDTAGQALKRPLTPSPGGGT
jgi:hypothetical protein